MRGITLENVMMITKLFLRQIIKPGSICVDATVGNGNDTLYLSELVKSDGFVYGFDVQETAVLNTIDKLVQESPYKNYNVIHDGHEKMDLYVKRPVDFVIFNLGYLPRADKNIKTTSSTTLPAIKKSLELLKVFGVLWVVVYPGHQEGYEESQILEAYFKSLNQNDYSVMKLELMNQMNHPPYILAIEKK